MYVTFPLFHINMPGNLFGILKVFISIASLDLLTDETMYSETFGHNPLYGMNEFNSRFTLIGFDSCSPVYNMGDLAVLQFWVFFKLGYLAAYAFMAKAGWYYFCLKKNKEYAKKYAEEKVSIFWNWPIRFVFEAYIEVTVASFLRMKTPDPYSAETGSDFLDSFLGILYMGLTFLAPIFFLTYFTWNH
jgi:hypothetical protein